MYAPGTAPCGLASKIERTRRQGADRNPDGRRRRAGAQPLHQGRRQPRRARGPRGDRIPARLGGAARVRPGRPRIPRQVVHAARRERRAHDRPHRRNVPAHLAHEPEPRTAEGRSCPPRPPHRRRGAVRLHRPRPARDRVDGHRRADPDRRRRHALVRAADARRGRSRDRDPEDDGQRRPRHRLLHRLLDRHHPRRAVHPQPAHVAPGRTSASPSSSCSAATAARRR